MIFKQIDLVDSCFSFFGFEITASTLMAKTSSMSRVPLPREMPADHLNALACFSIVSDNGRAFEFACQRATGEEQLLALKATIRPLRSKFETHWPVLAMPSLSREVFLVPVWLSVSATWLCCTRYDGPLDAVVLAAFPVGDEHNPSAWVKRSPELVWS